MKFKISYLETMTTTTKQTLMLLLLLCAMVSHKTKSQDIIVKLDKSQIEAKVVEIAETTIKYRKFQNLEGPIYSINTSEVSHIRYMNGSTEYYSGKKAEIEEKTGLSSENEKAVPPKTNKIPAYKPLPVEPVFSEPARKQEESLPKFVTQKPVVLPKVIVGVVGIGGLGFAYLTKTNYNKKLSDMNTMVGQFDKDPTGKIYQQSDYERYKSSFDEAQKLKTVAETKIMIGLGMAGVALLAETYLFIKKPKQRKLSLNPTSNGAQLTFKF